jgi:hypothetical protein
MQQSLQTCVNWVVVAQELADQASEPVRKRFHDFSRAGDPVTRIPMKDRKKTEAGQKAFRHGQEAA